MSLPAPPVLDSAQMKAAGHNLPEYFEVALKDNSVLQVHKILRVLPGKRIVAKASIGAKTLLAKLFFVEGESSKQAARELEGYRQLSFSGLKTPKFIRHLRTADGNTEILFFEFLNDAVEVQELLSIYRKEEKNKLLQTIFALIAHMHGKNIYQSDLHFGNFLYNNGDIYVIDTASVVLKSSSLDMNEKLDNIALMIAQLPVNQQSELIGLSRAYFSQQTIPENYIADITRRVRHAWNKRKNDYLEKIYRDCSYISEIRQGNMLVRCVRTETGFLNSPQKLYTNTDVLKNGNSAKVYRFRVDGRELVVKHYIYKNIWKALSRCWRESRASKSWYFAHLLQMLGVDVPRPVALMERKLGRFVLESWYISEYVPGETLQDHWKNKAPVGSEIATIKSIFDSLAETGLAHGDMKASNLVVNGKRIYLLDFDGMTEFAEPEQARPALNKDRARFLDNWKGRSFLPELEQALRQ